WRSRLPGWAAAGRLPGRRSECSPAGRVPRWPGPRPGRSRLPRWLPGLSKRHPSTGTRAAAKNSSRPSPPSGAESASEAQLAQLLRVALPVLGDLHEQVEEDRRPEERLDVAARGRADLAQARAAGADDDGLLAGALDVDVRPYVEEGTVGRAVL